MIIEYPGLFNKLFFTESLIGPWMFVDGDLIISVSGVFLFAAHPLMGHGCGPYAGEFVFDEVCASRRELTECIGDPTRPNGFKEPRLEVDVIEPALMALRSHHSEFGFEGYQDHPTAWVDLEVVARSFGFRVNLG